MDKVQTSFSVAAHGFQFPNDFELKLPVKFHLPLAGVIDLNDVVFGLCGGMCFTALDFFHARHALPKYRSHKDIDTRLLAYLAERQIDSLQISVLLKVIDWMTSESKHLASKMTKNEIPKLCRMLKRDEPAVLCLVRASRFEHAAYNHQVLATGFEMDKVSGKIVVTLYDPNHPGESPTITANWKRKEFLIKQSSGEALEGFFVMPYKAQKAIPLSPRAKESGAVSFDISPISVPPFQLKWPVDSRRINQYFGENPATYRPFKLAGHEGLDFFAPTGANIYAAFDGVVYEAKPRGAYGNQVRIQHEHNGIRFQTVYAHLEQILVTANQQVRAGDLIGKADNTGNSHGSHLHLTLFVDGAKNPGYYDGIVDPWPYLEGNEPVPLPLPSGITICTLVNVHLRALPSTVNSEILTTIPAGEHLPVFGDAAGVLEKIGKESQWLQVQTISGLGGYISAGLAADAAQMALPPSDLVIYAFDDLAIYSGPGLGLASSGKVSPSNPLVVLGNPETAKAKIGQTGEWIMVQTQDGKSGFVPAWLVHLTGQIASSTGMVIYPTGTVNLRAQPNTAYSTDTLAVVTPNDALIVLGDKDQAQAKIGVAEKWINVRAPNGVAGWIAAWLISSQNISPQHSGQSTTTDMIVLPTPEIGVNIRTSADVGAMRISSANFGEPLIVIETDLDAAREKIGVQDKWLYVQQGSHRGWIAAWLVSLRA